MSTLAIYAPERETEVRLWHGGIEFGERNDWERETEKRILVTGTQSWFCLDLARSVLRGIRAKDPQRFVVLHGNCEGVDAAFAQACAELDIEDEPHPARWYDLDAPGAKVKVDRKGRKYNAAAGPQRNREMIARKPRFAIAVHPDLGRSRGTRDCCRQCLEAGIAVWHVDEDGHGRRLTIDDVRR